MFTSVRAGDEGASGDFLGRLVAIDAEFAGDHLHSPELVKQRMAAVVAYDELSEGTDRHHQLEQLAQPLGVNYLPRLDLTAPLGLPTAMFDTTGLWAPSRSETTSECESAAQPIAARLIDVSVIRVHPEPVGLGLLSLPLARCLFHGRGIVAEIRGSYLHATPSGS